MATVKVSVIVPTYSPKRGLDRLVASLDRQSMPADEFEVIFVDDGSPDDTYQRLLTLSRSRPNYLVRRIPNSGWPSRPRNIGLDLARGEYVLFMDHDDRLYPDALRTAYAFAVAERADVVSAKETRTSEWFAYEWAFAQDIKADVPKTPTGFGPWTTHKLFRRRLLVEHGIRFREGRRALFEDVLVDISAYVHAQRIAVLASQPFYQWVHTPGANYSSTYGRDAGEYLASIAGIMDHAEAEAPGSPFSAWMCRYQYRLRVLGQLLGPVLLSRPAEARTDLVLQVGEFLAEHAPPEFDEGLDPVLGARAHLARRGDTDALVALARADRGVTPVPVATAVTWDEHGDLRVQVEVRWRGPAGAPLLLRRDGDRLLRTLPADVPRLPEHLLDVTDAVPAATAHLTVTDRDKTGWPAESSTPQTRLEAAGEGQVTPVTRFDAVVHRSGHELGRPLGPGPWDLTCRAGMIGYSGHRNVRFTGSAQVRGEGDAVAVHYPSARGYLCLRLHGSAAAVVWFARPAPGRASLSGRRRPAMLRVPLDAVQTSGRASLPVTAVFERGDPRQPALSRDGRLIVDAGGARLELPVDLPRGRYLTRVRAKERKDPVDAGIEVVVRRLGWTSITEPADGGA